MKQRAYVALPAFTNALASADATTRPALLRAVRTIEPPPKGADDPGRPPVTRDFLH
jgi:hypothetical protein